ncbi:MFS transporter [Staphylococcus gallinarum]|uniref:oligosaccharide MFS transporter n=1 Tax=Staphylococcus gallinarum TaxID=1293 RepID=UPI000E699073|nr:oligosaccharide MFS transporter [Staphylococcus gallinarum]RIO80858.1 MFS transporter [Staphylococcus gallinarum]
MALFKGTWIRFIQYSNWDYFSINSFTTLLFNLIYGLIQDRLGVSRILLSVCSFISIFTGPFFVYFYAPFLEDHFYIVGFIGSLFISSGFLAAMGLYEAVVEKFSRSFDFDYGSSRAWGSLGYAIISLFSGYLFLTNASLIFWSGSIISLLLFLLIILYKPSIERMPQTDSYSLHSTLQHITVTSIFRQPRFWILVIVILFTCPFYLIYEQQLFPSYYIHISNLSNINGENVYSILNSVQVFIEVLTMIVAPRIIAKLGIKQTIILSFIIMNIRVGGSLFAHDIVSISIVKLIHGIQIPLFVLPIFQYITLHFNTKFSATIYLLGYLMVVKIGQIIFSTPIGSFQDNTNFNLTFLLIFVVILITTIFAKFTLRKDA